MLDFTIGLTEGVAWPWPIAVYLFSVSYTHLTLPTIA